MTAREKYRERFSSYPDVVDLVQFRQMLGGIGEKTARKLMREKQVKHDVEKILIEDGRELLTLLSCHPYASGGKQRYVVYCERIPDP